MEVLLPFLVIFIASFFQGSFGLGMKYMDPLKWESWWVVHVFTAMVFIPVIWTLIAVPDCFSILEKTFQSSDPIVINSVRLAIFFGFAWGIGGIMFGISVPYIGLSLTMGIVMGLAGTLGSLIPLLQIENAFQTPQFPYVITGLCITIVGITLTAKAGIDRDKISNSEKNEKSNIFKGILIAIICGALSSLLAVGHTGVNDDVSLIASEFGVEGRNASLVAWLIVFIGAFAMNILYAGFLLIKNNSFSSFSTKGSGKAYKWAIIAGICWFAALGMYGQGAALMGSLGNIVGWPMLLGLSLIISNYWAFRAGEWDDAKNPFKILVFGIIVLVLASAVLGYSNMVT